MNVTSRLIDAEPQRVWDVLSDGWLYPLWVVGAARMRGVDRTWPAVGSRLHHSAGVWPLLLDDTTMVLDSEPPCRLVLQARGWPAGEAQVTITLIAHDQQTELTISEQVTGGPARLLPRRWRSFLIDLRNVEALRRLCLLVEGRTR